MLRFFKRLMLAGQQFGRAKHGSAAVEFAMVVVPFFMLTFGTAEVALIGLAQSNLNFAVSEAGRQIRTGQAQQGGLDKAAIEQLICDRLNSIMMMSCTGTLFTDVDRFDSFVDIAGQQDPIQNGNFNGGGLVYNPGGSSDIVVVRAYYRWHVVTPMFESILGNVNSGERILISTMMFRNEPF